jgi:hypothetical protein
LTALSQTDYSTNGMERNRSNLRTMDSTSSRFGSVAGQVHLPFATPPDSGPVALYLIPADVSAGQWSKDDSVLRAVYTRGQAMRFPGQQQQPGPGPSVISFLSIPFHPAIIA